MKKGKANPLPLRPNNVYLGVTLHNVYIMNENSGLVLTIEDGGEAGSKIVQTEYDPGEPSQLFDINYFNKQAVIFSTLWPDCVITVEGGR